MVLNAYFAHDISSHCSHPLNTPSHYSFLSQLTTNTLSPPGNYARNIFELLPRDPLTEVKQEGVCMRVDERGDYFVGLVPGKPYEVGAALATFLLLNFNSYLVTYLLTYLPTYLPFYLLTWRELLIPNY